ncbi:MAG: exosome complex RNA-binding protein Rrp4 [Candidatus Methanofastidiosa archaeon]|jgi:exosome complex component RRP4|nr:exosome complex protein Rrp4 [Candidatus Methanofastidiosa archaeon]MDD4281197.1 exosome complex RNA-binding protein Rrp4 [Candidatus Methanofastidiosa archaeon]
MELLVNERELVVPGTLLATGAYKYGGGVVKEGESYYSTVLGLFYFDEAKTLVRVVPLEGKYLPKEGDSVVGRIYKVLPGKWLVDINSAYIASLEPKNALHDRVEDLSRIYDEGDMIFAKVDSVNEIYDATLFTKSMPYGKLRGGTIVEIRSTRVPRLIGKKGSMIYMIKQETKAKILVGQNGLVWIKGRKEMEELIVRVVKMIDREAHISGLTDKTKEFLKTEIEKLKITGDN